MKVKSLSRVRLCDPMDCSLPCSSIHGIFQTRVLEWVAISFSRGSSQPRDRTWVSCNVGRRFTVWATREIPKKGNAKECSSSVQFSSVAQSCLTLCDPVVCSLPRSSVHGSFQARVLERVAISFSRGSSQPRDRTSISCLAGRFFYHGVSWEALNPGVPGRYGRFSSRPLQ